MGSTACIIYITLENSKRILYCAHVGDTRAVLVKNIGQKVWTKKVGQKKMD